MLQLSVREFNKNISKSFRNLPVEITNRGVVIARISAPNGTPMPAPAKFVKINKEDLKGGIKVDMKKAREGMAGTINPGLGRVPEVSKNAGERSSVTPSPSATLSLKKTDTEIAREIDEASSKIPFFRKKLCPKHSVFSCGCPEKTEKEGKGEQR